MENKTVNGIDSLDISKIMDNVGDITDERLVWHKDMRCFPSVYETTSKGNPCINVHMLPSILPIMIVEINSYCNHFLETHNADELDTHKPSDCCQKMKDCTDELLTFLMKNSWQFTSVKSHYESVLESLKAVIGDDVSQEMLLKTVIESIVMVAVNEGFPNILIEHLYKFYIKEVKRLYDVDLDLTSFRQPSV